MLTIIVATDRKGAIGRNNDIPWHLSDDLKRFKAITMGHTVIMGRNTWDSLPFKPLKGRRNIVISATMPESDKYDLAQNVDRAIAMASADGEAFIMGGARIYEQTIAYADKLLLTLVDRVFEDADRFFPTLNADEWTVAERSGMLHDDVSGLDYEYITYIRKR